MRILVICVMALTMLFGASIFGSALIGCVMPEVDAWGAFRTDNSEVYPVDAERGVPRRLIDNVVDAESPVWSPDKRQIAFVSYQTGNQEVFVMDADGSNLRNLSNHSAADSDPVWSPDGKQLAFTSWRDENFEIYLINSDGSNLHNLSNHPDDDTSPVWSSYGRFITFDSRRDNAMANRYVADLGSRTLKIRPLSC